MVDEPWLWRSQSWTDGGSRSELVATRLAEIEQRVQSSVPDVVRFVVDGPVRTSVGVHDRSHERVGLLDHFPRREHAHAAHQRIKTDDLGGIHFGAFERAG